MRAAIRGVLHWHWRAAGTIEHQLLLLCRQHAKRLCEVDVITRCQPFQQRPQERELLWPPHGNSTVQQRTLRVRDEEVGGKLHMHAQPITGSTGALGTVEREQARGQLRATGPTVRAGEAFAEHEMRTVDDLYAYET